MLWPLAERIIESLASLKQLTVKGDRMSDSDFALRKANLPEEKRRLLEKRLLGKAGVKGEEQAIPKRRITGPVPLSLSQERLWFSGHIKPDSPLHNAPSAIRLEGPLEVGALERALSDVVRRHEVLRTTFRVIDGQPFQIINPPAPITMPIVDLQEYPDRREQSGRVASEEARRSVDLSTSPCFRVSLLRLRDDEHILLFTTHHLVFDGWSKGVLIRDMVAFYQAHAACRPAPLEELPIQYADFSIWQRESLTGEARNKYIDYWGSQLEGAPLLELPPDKPRPAAPTFNGMRHWIEFPHELSNKVLSLSRTEDATLFIVLLAAFKILLNRYTRQEDITIGTHVAGRTRPALEGLIGFFVNQLPLRVRLSGKMTFRELIGSVREVSLEAYQHQDLPFEKVLEAFGIKPLSSSRTFFRVLFSFHNAPRPPLRVPELKHTVLTFDDRLVRFDLEFDLWWGSQGIEGFLVQNTDLYRASTIAKLINDYQELLGMLVIDPERRISTLPPFAF